MIKTNLTRPRYQLLTGLLVLGALFLGSAAWSQPDWSQGLSDRQRFMLFPHVDSGLRALEQNRFEKARSEFERAAKMAPDNPVIALYLAQSYADAADLRQALIVLDEQLQRTPDVQLLIDARDVYAQRLTADLLAQAAALRTEPAKLREFLLSHRPEVMSPYIESEWLSLLADASTPTDDLLSGYRVEFAQHEVLKRELRLFMFVRGGAIELAQQMIAQWPQEELESYDVVDSLTFQLLTQDQPDLAVEFLTRALPWVKASPADKEALVERVTLPYMASGLRALEQNQFETARSEFERAAKMAPDNPVIALYLAQSYADAADLRQALIVLDEQLQRTPGVQILIDTREVYAQRLTADSLAQAAALRTDPAKLREFLLSHRPEVMSPYIEAEWLSLLADASTPTDDLLSGYRVEFAQHEALKRELRLFMFVRGGATQLAQEMIAQWPQEELESYDVVDSLTFQLLAQDQPDLAVEFLTRALPWVKASPPDREALIQRVILAQARTTDQAALQAYLQAQSGTLKSATQEREWLSLASAGFGPALEPLVAHDVIYPENRSLFVSELLQRLEAGVPLPTGVSWPGLLTRLGRAASRPLIESLTFRLTQINQYELAWQILMNRYPFEDLAPAVQTELMQRIALLAQRNPRLLTPADKALLSVPLDTVELREMQAQTLAIVSDCVGIVSVLGDWSHAYGAQQWLMLGNCYEKNQQSGLAQYAFEQAVKRQPSSPNRRALAYVAFQNKDDAVALEQWQSVIQANDLNEQDWLAAVATAEAAGNMTLVGQWLDRYEQIGADQNARYWALKARWVSGSDKVQAIDAMQQSLALEPTAEHYVELAKWQGEVGQPLQAIESLKAAIALDPDNGAAQAQLGFALYAVDDLPDARIHLISALALRPNDVQVTQQLAYVDQKLGLNADARRYIEQSVDQLLRYPSQELTDEQQETLFALRRMNEDLSRRWTLSFDALMGTGSSVSVQSPDPLDNFRSYSQLEFDYRLGPQGIDNGKTVSAYARVFGGSGTQNSVLPIYAPTLGVGLRVKPFSDQVIYFAAERQIPLDHGTSPPANTMLRASASFFNEGEYSDDWHPVGPGWPTQNLYLDAAYYLSDKAWSLIADYRYGYHHKLAMGQTVQPYARLVTQKISNESTVDIRVGAGVRWNLWANESRYSAYSSRYYIGFEIQGALQTYQSDRVTALLTLGARW